MTKKVTSRPAPPVREVNDAAAPVGARCRLCKLYAEDHHGAAIRFEVMYGGRRLRDEGNELVALDRESWLCWECLDALRLFWQSPQE